MIVTLYENRFWNGIGQPIELKPGDVLTVRQPNDGSFELLRTVEGGRDDSAIAPVIPMHGVNKWAPV